MNGSHNCSGATSRSDKQECVAYPNSRPLHFFKLPTTAVQPQHLRNDLPSATHKIYHDREQVEHQEGCHKSEIGVHVLMKPLPPCPEVESACKVQRSENGSYVGACSLSFATRISSMLQSSCEHTHQSPPCHHPLLLNPLHHHHLQFAHSQLEYLSCPRITCSKHSWQHHPP